MRHKTFLPVCVTALLLAPAANAQPATMPTKPAFRRLTSVVNAYASFSPDGKTVAYQSNATGNWDIYLMNLDGTGVRPIVSSSAADITPVFSPDGRHIAFCSERDGNRNVYVCDADGSNQKRLTDDPGNDLHP